MLHYVGHCEDGAVYRDGETDEEHLLPDFVGQIVDWSEPAEEDEVSVAREMAVTRVGALLGPQPSGGAQRADTGLAHSRIKQPLETSQVPPPYAISPGIIPATKPEATPPAAAEPWWAHYGELEGGHYVATPHPGATFEAEAFGSPEDLAAMEAGEETPEDVAEEAPPVLVPTPISPHAIARGRRTGITRASGDFAGAIVMPWDVQAEACRQAKWQQGTAKKRRMRPGSPGGPPATGGRTPQRIAAEKAHAAYCEGYQKAQCDAQACAAPPDAGPPQGYGPPPGYGYGPPLDQGDYGDEGGEDYEGEEEYESEEEAQFAAGYADHVGAAPEGLGAGIGGLAGGALGMFIGAPELGAPLGAALGGAIQGVACHGGGAMPGGGMHAAPQASRTYQVSGKAVRIGGTFAPDGLFDPGPPASPDQAAMVNLISMSNSLLRKYHAGGSFRAQGRGGAAVKGVFEARYGSVECDAEALAEARAESTAVTGWFEDAYGRVECGIYGAADETADVFERGANIVKHWVSGGPVAKDYGPYSGATVNHLLDALHGQGFAIEGANPYDVDVKQHGVTLRATWHPDSGLVTIAITGSNFYVSHNQVWDKIDPLMPGAG